MYMRNGEGVTSYYGGDTYRAWLTLKDSAGDATVPANSGLAPRTHSKFFATMRGFEHQDSYNNESVRELTLYSVLQLASTATNLA
jgi:hypothetical protein